MVTINMLDGEKIEVHPDTILIGIDNAPITDEQPTFYLKQKYIGNLQGDFEKNGSALATKDERLGIAGFLLSHDLFSIGDGEDKTLYFTSAIKSISVK
ncbi:hypothetical protein G4D61_11200 [Bacillus ginsengihumi]|uniref:Uncharacterized protein n=1 Tax=Heyndrickxia ginsengihumi TaxID=363870 RepID=A0A0A6VDV4_9BACI|nr:hypothetical protein [Heyndrickxia ginsengihumi]KHD85668.1 hypothetical protein NG54_07815 [Heyndrickxia ginsengihumi]NEY20522.1 hypothetical protein [Heyndrickxia ginsengihumi]